MKKFVLITFSYFLITYLGSGAYGQVNGTYPLLEFSTGTWCSSCPCGDQAAENILSTKPNTLVLAYHGGGGGDPFLNFNGNSILALLGLYVFPTGVVSRISGVRNYPSWDSLCNTVINNYQPSISYSITKTYNQPNRQLQVTANVTALRNIDTNCNINLVITEDGVVYPQTGSPSCPGGTNYVHKWIVRNMVNGALGEQLSSGSWSQGTTKTKSWTTTIDTSWIAANCRFNIFVYLLGSGLATHSFVLQTFKNGVTTPIGIKQNQHIIPETYRLEQNYPNPFNPVTNIKFSTPEDGNVSLRVYDITGALIQTYFDGFIKAGVYNAEVDAANLASGVYFYTLSAGKFIHTRKMIVIK